MLSRQYPGPHFYARYEKIHASRFFFLFAFWPRKVVEGFPVSPTVCLESAIIFSLVFTLHGSSFLFSGKSGFLYNNLPFRFPPVFVPLAMSEAGFSWLFMCVKWWRNCSSINK